MSLATLPFTEINSYSSLSLFAVVGVGVIAVVSGVGYVINSINKLVVDNKELKNTVGELKQLLEVQNKRLGRMEKELEQVVDGIYEHTNELNEELEARIAEVDLKCEEQIEKEICIGIGFILHWCGPIYISKTITQLPMVYDEYAGVHIYGLVLLKLNYLESIDIAHYTQTYIGSAGGDCRKLYIPVHYTPEEMVKIYFNTTEKGKYWFYRKLVSHFLKCGTKILWNGVPLNFNK